MPSIPPAGYSPASAFELVRHDEQLGPVPILADAIDATTGEYTSVEDSATIADGLVVTLLRTKRGSGAAVLEFGQRFQEIRHVTDDAVVLGESLTREALQPAIDAGVVAFRQISTQANPDDPTQLDDVVDYLDMLAPAAEQAQQLPVNLK
jgi:hypothetical protein